MGLPALLAACIILMGGFGDVQVSPPYTHVHAHTDFPYSLAQNSSSIPASSYPGAKNNQI